MSDYRNFFKRNKEARQQYQNMAKKDKQGYIHVMIHSLLFSNMDKTIIGTNGMYNELKEDIIPCIEPFSPKDKICVEVLETEESTDFGRQTAILGFKRYMNSLLYGQRKAFFAKFAVFFSFVFVGILIEFLLYFVVGQDACPPNLFWLFKSAEVLGTLFIWQFGGYMVFDFPGEVKSLKQNKQIANAKFVFKHFE